MDGLVSDRESLNDLLETLITYGPEGGAYDERLKPEAQLTNQVMFAAIRGALNHVPGLVSDRERYERAVQRLHESERAFEDGDDDRACEILLDLQDEWFYADGGGRTRGSPRS